jgi:hypothetical protein
MLRLGRLENEGVRETTPGLTAFSRCLRTRRAQAGDSQSSKPVGYICTVMLSLQ